MCYSREKAFTLTELLVVISVIAMLMAILMPALAAARSRGRALACESNLRQLLLAEIGYATENDGAYVPAASDLWDNSGLHRWHGIRETSEAPFNPLRGPLAGYLADGRVKECPAKADFVKGQDWKKNFEQGCGGYGYNMTYIGSRLWQKGVNSVEVWKDSYATTTRMSEVTSPGRTLMFADTAIANDRKYLIEYSFVEPPFTVRNGLPVTDFYMSPSIHFRHSTLANIGWADGHIERRRLAEFDASNAYGIDSVDMKLGWFDPIDNSPYDLKYRLKDMKEKVMLSWSGGKDSAMALYALLQSGRYEIVSLLTTVSEQYDRISHHGVRVELLEQQAASLGIPLHVLYLPQASCSLEDYEALMKKTMLEYKDKDVLTVAFGDIFLQDLRDYRERNLAKVEMGAIFPIWGRDTTEIVRTFIDFGFKAFLTCVESKKLGKEFAGRPIDGDLIRDLPDGVDPCGENGEFHSFVYDGPMFQKPVDISVGEVVLRDVRYFADLVSIERRVKKRA